MKYLLLLLAPLTVFSQALPATDPVEKAAILEVKKLQNSEILTSLTPSERTKFLSRIVKELYVTQPLDESTRVAYIDDVTAFMNTKREAYWNALQPKLDAKIASLGPDYVKFGEFTWMKLEKQGEPITDPGLPISHKVFITDAITNKLLLSQPTFVAFKLEDMPQMVQEFMPFVGLNGKISAYVRGSRPENVGSPGLYYIELTTEKKN
jgi:hypothetical protein